MYPEKSKNDQATNSAAAALADCEDLMLCVLARLPVKSICRFKSVCKHWNHLFSTQEFVGMQFKHSTESKNQCFIIQRINDNGSSNISVFNIESSEEILDQPFNDTHVEIDVVGCCNGLICIRRGEEFVLWNPAMNLYKTVSSLQDHWIFKSSSLVVGYDAEVDHFKMSLGFGYDAEGDDFKVAGIVFMEKERRLGMHASWVEVYSANSNSWTIIDPGFQFSELGFCWIHNSATVNGNPYWVGEVDEESKHVLIRFDMSKLVFKVVPLTSLNFNKAEQNMEFIDLNGSLGALVSTWKNEERIEYVDSWVFDDAEQIWTKRHSVGPIKVEMDQVVRSLKDGRVLGMRPNGQLIVLSSETKFVKDLFNVGPEYFRSYDYTASLAYIQGMEKVKLKKRRDHWNKSKDVLRNRSILVKKRNCLTMYEYNENINDIAGMKQVKVKKRTKKMIVDAARGN
ncbi:hypothetical protein CASFOL_027828 [Castilleja foliolosa]|uniref:F-box domain-containing protein n=1 Tax=Castilleja foliolosa TaxID=1961234 RepID=A0ABD3CGU2_9LAMI